MRTIAISVLAGLILVCSAVSFGQTRTTPVQVENSPTVKIDYTENKVKIDPAWNTVQVGNNAFVNVVNTPTVNVGNSPVVKMDSTQNTVKTFTQSNMISFGGSITIAHGGGTLDSPLINCTGYKEIRLAVTTVSMPSSPANLKINLRYKLPISGSYTLFGSGSFAPPTTSVISSQNFSQAGYVAMMIAPVMSDYARIEIVNNMTFDVTISEAWVLLVN